MKDTFEFKIEDAHAYMLACAKHKVCVVCMSVRLLCCVQVCICRTTQDKLKLHLKMPVCIHWNVPSAELVSLCMCESTYVHVCVCMCVCVCAHVCMGVSESELKCKCVCV